MTDKRIPTGSALKIEDISKDIDKLLTDKGKLAVRSFKCKGTLRQVDGKIKMMQYFSVTSKTRSIGALRIANLINEISEQYEITGILAQPSQISLHNPDGDVAFDRICTLVFLEMSPEDGELAIKHPNCHYEGGVSQFEESTDEEIEQVKKAGLEYLDKDGITNDFSKERAGFLGPIEQFIKVFMKEKDINFISRENTNKLIIDKDSKFREEVTERRLSYREEVEKDPHKHMAIAVKRLEKATRAVFVKDLELKHKKALIEQLDGTISELEKEVSKPLYKIAVERFKGLFS